MQDRFIGLKLDERYEITELIGVGGMSNVYKGIDIMERRTVAVKILKNEFCENDEFVRRFRNESKAIAVLNHPNIVRIFDVNYENNIQYIVMEYIDGITLKEFIEQRGRLEWRDTVHITIQILRALQLAHDRGIVHRDIKPQNIMLLRDGTIKVMDFGIARFCRQNNATLTEKAMGSVHYVSPEQASAERTDERSDIYSVGVMMYEMLTGRKPFDGDTPVAVALMHINDTPEKPSTYVSSLYKGLEEIILRAMEKDPNRRYSTASGMIYDIEAFKQDQSVTFGYGEEEIKSKRSAKVSDVMSVMPAIKMPKFKRSKTNEEPVQEEYYYEDDDDEEEHHSYVLPILAAVTVTVIIVATLFVGNVILSKFKTTPSSSNDYVMPSLIGKNFYEARNEYPDIQLVASEEFNSDYASGLIVSQEKAEGRIVKVGDVIRVVVSKGKRIIVVPDVVEYHYNSAHAALSGENLSVLRIETENDDVPAGYVVRTDPVAGNSVPEFSTIKVYVSIGPSTSETSVPNVVGYNVSEAEDMIKDAYLEPKIQYVESSEPADTVIDQNIAGGDIVTRNTVITLYVSDGYGAGVTNPNAPQGGVSMLVAVDIPLGTYNTYYFTIEDKTNGVYLVEREFINTAEFAGGQYTFTVVGSGLVEAYVSIYSPRTGYTTQLAKLMIDFNSDEYYTSDYSSLAFSLVDWNF